MKPRQLNSG